MDELTLNGEKYISSKRAAKTTGYTKDYVGQLCREGKIIAQLVGRNWYVSEASIHKHRFELEDQPTQTISTPKHVTHSTDVRHSVLHDSVHYINDDVNIIPLQKKEQAVAPVQKIEVPQDIRREEHPQKEKPDVLSAMQNTWQEWFTPATHEEKDEDIDTQDTEMEDSEVSDARDYGIQPVSVRRMSPVHLTPASEDKSAKENDVETVKREHSYAKSVGMARVLNIVLMIIALLFFIVALLNIFLSAHTSINQLQYLTGVSVYTAK